MNRTWFVVALGALVLTSCGGGDSGGGGTGNPPATPNPPAPQATFALSPTTLTFSAAAPDTPAPQSQVVTGTVTGTVSGTLYVVATVSGVAVANVSDFVLAANSGQASVTARLPTIGLGTHSSTITVRACVNDPTCATGQLGGSPQTINVSYTIGGDIPDTVMPRVAAAGSTGQVVIRGRSLAGTTGVAFGATPATAFTVVSDTEIRATYPPTLAAGQLPVVLTGAPAFSASIFVVNPVEFTEQLLAYPEPSLYRLNAVLDSEHSTLFVAVEMQQRSANKIWRYTYNGANWNTATAVTVPNLVDIALSQDGTRLWALTDAAILELDAANPAAGVLVTRPAPFPVPTANIDTQFKSLALTNDRNAVLVTTAYLIGQWGDPYLYSGAHQTISPLLGLGLNARVYYGTVTGSADGSRTVVSQSPPSTRVFVYNSSTGRYTQTSIMAAGPAVLDSAASRIALRDLNVLGLRIYDGNLTSLGMLPGQSSVAVINPRGTRAHTLNDSGALTSYDLTAATVLGAFPTLGAPRTVANLAFGSGGLWPAVTPDGGTVFIAGITGILVLPVPP